MWKGEKKIRTGKKKGGGDRGMKGRKMNRKMREERMEKEG